MIGLRCSLGRIQGVGHKSASRAGSLFVAGWVSGPRVRVRCTALVGHVERFVFCFHKELEIVF